MNHLTAKNIIILAILALGIAALILFGISPSIDRYKTLQQELLTTQNELELAQEKTSSLKILASREDEIKSIESMMFQYLPSETESADFVVKLEALAKELSIPEHIPTLTVDQDYAEIKKNQKQKDFVAFRLSFKTDYQKIQTFIRKIEAFPRLSAIDSLSFSNYSEDENALDVQLAGKAYYGE